MTPPTRVAMVCLGNICRSPIAEVVLTALVAERGLSDQVSVWSAGTADYHVGRPMDPRAAATLRTAGLDPTRHRAQQFGPAALERCDLALAMDRANLEVLQSLLGDRPAPRVRLFGDFDPQMPGAEVPDPYYGGDEGFTDVLAQVQRTADALLDQIVREREEAAR